MASLTNETILAMQSNFFAAQSQIAHSGYEHFNPRNISASAVGLGMGTYGQFQESAQGDELDDFHENENDEDEENEDEEGGDSDDLERGTVEGGHSKK